VPGLAVQGTAGLPQDRGRPADPPGPHDFKLLVAAAGRTATTMDDVAEASDRNSLVA
jgi:hypothetical protein